MLPRKPRAGFTLIELLVVVAIIALLISILLPSLKEAREQGKKAVCLANLRSLSQGNNGYASEDEIESALPIQQQVVSNTALLTQGGLPAEWAHRTVMTKAYGGRTAQVPFMASNAIMDPNGRWAARTRPLNQYTYGDLEQGEENDLAIYRCPSDSGYPDSPFIIDAPPQITDIPCYDVIGNSFSMNFTGVNFGFGVASFTVAPYGHRLSTLQNTARYVALMEPQFYSMTYAGISGPIPRELLLRGWHGAVMTSNVAFVDGSARPTKVSDLDDFDANALREMNYTPNVGPTSFLRRGAEFQMDCYPTPGAFIAKYAANGQIAWPSSNLATYTGWPFTGYQNNLRPPE
jgi:prepilin-type N-terminal cleavage/methylation domain-containing protein/prepilin-type processing-associated H-X9-DG protein